MPIDEPDQEFHLERGRGGSVTSDHVTSRVDHARGYVGVVFRDETGAPLAAVATSPFGVRRIIDALLDGLERLATGTADNEDTGCHEPRLATPAAGRRLGSGG